MSITYDWYETPTSNGEEGERELHPRIFLNGKVNMERLYRMVHERSSLSVGDVKNAVENLALICGEELREGRSVHIEGLGYFTPVLTSTEKVTRSTKNKWNKVAFKTVSFRPDTRLRGVLRGIKAHQSKYSNHSVPLSAVAIDMRLKNYFEEHDVLSRVDFQELCSLTRTTANRHLHRLQEEGMLQNIGQRRQPLYVAAPGFYGVSRDKEVRR